MLLPLNVFQYDSKCATVSQESSPLQTASFAGKEYSLNSIDEKTPILFQWFEAKPERYKKDDIPILNTKEHPYLNNIINASKIESERIIGILVDGDFTAEQKNAFSRLESNHQNIKVIYRKDVDFSMYDKKLSDICFEKIHEQELYPVKNGIIIY